MKPRNRILTAVCLCLAAIGLSSPASGQSAPPPPRDGFGTQDGIDLWIPATRFTGNANWVEDLEGGYFYSSANATFAADVPLPQGAYLDSWNAFFFDASGSDSFSIYLEKYYDDSSASPTRGASLISFFSSSGSPGYANHREVVGQTIDLREPYVLCSCSRNEAADFYLFHVSMPLTAEVKFKGVRVFWHRQVSPAPAAATFTDVPTTDSGFQFIEALAASGITAGCQVSPPKYCPDDTLTRRQMAVFLAKALGLHWPPF